ncbi:MAG: FAD-dependent oxidoreductase [Planctomycetota bacterium]
MSPATPEDQEAPDATRASEPNGRRARVDPHAARAARGRPRRVAVVGAGLAGLTLTRALLERGEDVTCFDKGRGPGGRMSTRRADPFAFDHGAQYFTARDPAFRAEVEAWCAAGVAARWTGRLAVFGGPDDGAGPFQRQDLGALGARDERFVGVPGMNAIGRRLGAALGPALRQGVRVASVAPRAGGGYDLADDAGAALGAFDSVLVTTPPSQAAPLVAASPELAALAASVAMDPCWAVMVAFEAPLEAGCDGAFVNGGAFSWIARDSSKPERGAGEAWVLHASAEWSKAHLERTPDEIVALAREALGRVIGASLPPEVYAAAHRWRFAAAAPPLEVDAAFDAARSLGIAGDWLAGSKVQGAWRSGRALAARFLRDCD